MTFENPMRLELHEGDKVVAQITKRGNRHSEHVCEIVSSYGSSMKASACAMSVLEVNGLTPVSQARSSMKLGKCLIIQG